MDLADFPEYQRPLHLADQDRLDAHHATTVYKSKARLTCGCINYSHYDFNTYNIHSSVFHECSLFEVD